MLDLAHIFGASECLDYLKAVDLQYTYLRQKDIDAIAKTQFTVKINIIFLTFRPENWSTCVIV
jgi:hypothetical protein